jgi:hypothetical protein
MAHGMWTTMRAVTRGAPVTLYGLLLYAYVVLLVGSFLAYRGMATWPHIALIAFMLILPRLLLGYRVRGAELAGSVSNALIFALMSYGLGRAAAFMASV